MFDIAWSELALIGAVALIVIGPKDLPKVMGTMGRWARQARLLAAEFQRNVDEMVREADVEEVRRQMQGISAASVKAKAEEIIGAKEIHDALKLDPSAPAAPPPPSAAPPPIPDPPATVESPPQTSTGPHP